MKYCILATIFRAPVTSSLAKAVLVNLSCSEITSLTLNINDSTSGLNKKGLKSGSKKQINFEKLNQFIVF